VTEIDGVAVEDPANRETIRRRERSGRDQKEPGKEDEAAKMRRREGGAGMVSWPELKCARRDSSHIHAAASIGPFHGDQA
jgi:hypothetical protein